MVEHLTRLLDSAAVVPAVNQIEIHPYFQQRDVQAFDTEHGILNQAWSPLGGITFYRDGSHGGTLQDPVIGRIAAAHGRTPAQVMLRWRLQEGRPDHPEVDQADPDRSSPSTSSAPTSPPTSWGPSTPSRPARVAAPNPTPSLSRRSVATFRRHETALLRGGRVPMSSSVGGT